MKSPAYRTLCRPCGTVFSDASWRALPLAALREEEPGLFLEMRACPCGATLGLEIRGTVACRVLADEAEKIVRETRETLAEVADEILDLIGGKETDAAP